MRDDQPLVIVDEASEKRHTRAALPPSRLCPESSTEKLNRKAFTATCSCVSRPRGRNKVRKRMVQTKKRYSNLFLNVLVGRVLTPKDVAKAACLAVLPIVWSDDLVGQIGDGHR